MDIGLVFMFACFILSAMGEIEQTRFVRYFPMKEKSTTITVVWDCISYTNVGCAKLCAELDTCKSLSFNNHTGHCRLYKVLATTVGPRYHYDRYYYVIKGLNDWCPVDIGFQYLTKEGPCVKFHTDKKSWSKAAQFCKSYSPYSRLVVLDNQQKNEVVKQAGKAIDHIFRVGIWIGLSKDHNGTYRWINGRYLKFTDWNPENIVSDVHDCVWLFRMRGWTWAHSTCTKDKHYICEMVLDTEGHHS